MNDMENLRLSIGLRRNKQTREWPDYKNALSKATGIPENELLLVQAEDSVHFEKLLLNTVEDGVHRGLVNRSPELSLEAASNLVENSVGKFEGTEFIVWLCHGADFAFRLRSNLLANYAFRLLEFDGDTIYAASSDAKSGVGIDVYVSELTNEISYSVDCWNM